MYKRQTGHSRRGCCGANRNWKILHDDRLKCCSKRNVVAVSYTHLDVYKRQLLSAVFAAFMLLSACGGSTQKDTSAQDSRTTSQVASASDMTDVEDVVEDGMTPITGDKVKDGTYDVTVDSLSLIHIYFSIFAILMGYIFAYYLYG